MNTTGALPGVDGGMPMEGMMGNVTIIGGEGSNATVVYPDLKAANVSTYTSIKGAGEEPGGDYAHRGSVVFHRLTLLSLHSII
jgi:hypothetical protein